MNTTFSKTLVTIALFAFSGIALGNNTKSVTLKKEDGQFYIVNDRPLVLSVTRTEGRKAKSQTMNTGQHPSTYKKVFLK